MNDYEASIQEYRKGKKEVLGENNPIPVSIHLPQISNGTISCWFIWNDR